MGLKTYVTIGALASAITLFPKDAEGQWVLTPRNRSNVAHTNELCEPSDMSGGGYMRLLEKVSDRNAIVVSDSACVEAYKDAQLRAVRTGTSRDSVAASLRTPLTHINFREGDTLEVKSASGAAPTLLGSYHCSDDGAAIQDGKLTPNELAAIKPSSPCVYFIQFPANGRNVTMALHPNRIPVRQNWPNIYSTKQ